MVPTTRSPSRLLRAAALVAILTAGAAPAHAQGARPETAKPATPRQDVPAQDRAAATAPRTLRGPFTVVSGSVFRWRSETFQVADIRAPRARTGACTYERLRGREARKALRRLLGRGDVVVTPTGRVSPLGYRLVRVSARGRDVRRSLIDAGLVLPSRAGQPSNPWCL